MSLCGAVRRTSNATKVIASKAKPPRLAPKELEASEAHIVSAAYARERGWGGAGAIRGDKDDILYNGNSFIAFKTNDTWPRHFTVDGARYHTADVLASAERLKAGNGANMAHIIAHELGHECGLQHTADNTVMNSEKRATATAAEQEADYQWLRAFVLERLPAIQVHVKEWHP